MYEYYLDFSYILYEYYFETLYIFTVCFFDVFKIYCPFQEIFFINFDYFLVSEDYEEGLSYSSLGFGAFFNVFEQTVDMEFDTFCNIFDRESFVFWYKTEEED